MFKLGMYDYLVGKDKAEKYVLSLCKSLNVQINGRSDLQKKIIIETESKRLEIDLAHEVIFTVKYGRADVLQAIHDLGDRFLNSPMSMGVSSNVPGLGINISIAYGGYISSINNHGYIEAPETSFSNEISLYRREAIKAFNVGDFMNFSRCYRAFLQSAVSLVECFIHRYTFHVKNMIPSTDSYNNITTLDSRQGLETRLDAWIETFAVHRMYDFKQSRTRSKFIEIKNQRNNIVHPSMPTIQYEVKTVVRYMNYVQEGVGGLLADLRKYSGQSPDIGFIRQIKTEPEIRVLKIV